METGEWSLILVSAKPKLGENRWKQFHPETLPGFQATKNPALKRRDSYYVAENSYFFAYFFLNLSIRPAVSTSMFFPVKKG